MIKYNFHVTRFVEQYNNLLNGKYNYEYIIKKIPKNMSFSIF